MTKPANDSQPERFGVFGSESESESEEEGNRFFERLRDDDPTAASDLFMHYFDRLADWLARRNPRTHPDDCETAAIEAIYSVIRNPNSYWPEKLSLWAFLRMSAQGDLKNILKSEQRHQSRRSGSIFVEQCSEPGNDFSSESDDPAKLAEWREECERLQLATQQFDASLSNWSEADRKMLSLMRRNVRETSEYAKVLGIEDWPPKEQAKEVKRAKDRLKKRLERSGGGHVEQA